MTQFPSTGFGDLSRLPTPSRGWAAREFGRGKPKTIRALAKAFMKYRAAKRAEDPSVDIYFSRGESAARFAHFSE